MSARPDVLLFSRDASLRAAWAGALAGIADLTEASAPEELRKADVVVIACDERLLEHVQQQLHRARIVLCGPSLPEAVLDVAVSGAEVRHAETADTLAVEVLAAARTRSPSARFSRHGLAVRWSSGPRALDVVDVSNGGLSFRLELDDGIEALLPGTVLEGATVSCEQGEALRCDGLVVRYVEQVSAAEGPWYRIGCEFAPAPVVAHRTARLTDRAARAGHLRAALRAGIQLSSLDGASTVTYGAGNLDLVADELHLRKPSPPFGAPFTPHEVVRGSFELAGGSYTFLSSVQQVSPLVVKVPAVVEVAQRRGFARHRPGDDRFLDAELRAPLWGDDTQRRRLLDVSTSGLSFAVDPRREVCPIGMRLSVVRLRIGDTTVRCEGRVKNLVPLAGADLVRCGIEFERLSDDERARLAAALLHHRFPGLADGAELCFDELWRFFLDTRFVYPEKLEALAPLLPAVRTTFDRLHEGGSKLYRSFIFRESDKVWAHLSTVRAYRRSWVVQHLAGTTRLKGRQAPQVVNVGFAEHFAETAAIEYIKIFFRPDNKWPARVFGGFARRFSDRQLSDLRTFSYLSVPTKLELLEEPTIEVEETSDPAALRLAEAHYARTEKGLLLRSDDLTRAGLQLEAVSDEYARAGLSRRRALLLATDRGAPVGFALCELSSPGLNLSELLSAFRVVVLPGADAVREARIRRALIRAAQQWYRAHERPLAIGLFAQGELDGLALPVGSTKEYSCWTTHRTLARRFSEYMDRMYELFNRERTRKGPASDVLPDGLRLGRNAS